MTFCGRGFGADVVVPRPSLVGERPLRDHGLSILIRSILMPSPSSSTYT
jgi:hypothetical protein